MNRDNKKPTIALLCTTLHHLGGLSRHILQVYNNIDRKKFRVVLIYFSYQQETIEEFFLKGGVQQNELHFVPINKKALFFSGVFRINKLLKQERVDLIHTFLLHSDVLGFFASWFSPVKALISSVEGKFMLDETNGVSPFKQKCYRFLNSWIRKHFYTTITVSEALKTEVIKERANARKIKVIPIGIKIPEQELNAQEEQNNDHPMSITCLSRFSLDKGVHYFIEAIPKIHEALPQARFVIAGKGEEEVRLRKMVSDSNLQNIVTFLGWVEDIDEFFKVTDVFVMPSMREGCPIGLLEALSYAKPTVAFKVDGIREIMRPGYGGVLIEPFNIERFAAAVVQLSKDKTYAQQLGLKGRELVQKEFSIHREAKQIMEEYSLALRN